MSTRTTTLWLCAAILGFAALAAVPGSRDADEAPLPAWSPAPGAVPVTRSPRVEVPAIGGSSDPATIAAAPGGAARLGVTDRPEPLRLAVETGLAAVFDDRVAPSLSGGALGFPVAFEPGPDRLAIERVLTAERPAALTTRPPSMREAKAGLGEEFVGTWVPVVVVHPANPLRSLSAVQMRELLRGAIEDWSGVGGSGGAVHRILPPSGPRAQMITRSLLPGDALGPCDPIADPLERLRRVAMDPLALTVVALPLAERARAPRLGLDGVRPEIGAVRLGQYRFGLPVHLVYGRDPDPRLARLIAAVRSGGFASIAANELVPAR